MHFIVKDTIPGSYLPFLRILQCIFKLISPTVYMHDDLVSRDHSSLNLIQQKYKKSVGFLVMYYLLQYSTKYFHFHTKAPKYKSNQIKPNCYVYQCVMICDIYYFSKKIK